MTSDLHPGFDPSDPRFGPDNREFREEEQLDRQDAHVPAPGQAPPVPTDPAEIREHAAEGLVVADRALSYKLTAERLEGRPFDLVLHEAHRKVRLALIWLGEAA